VLSQSQLSNLKRCLAW